MHLVRGRLRKPAWDVVLLALLPVLLHAHSFDVGLFLDDFAILGRLQAWREGTPGATWWDLYFLGAYDDRLRFSGVLPWWTDEGIRLHFFRPLAAATHALDVLLWPKHPWLMHVHSALWLSAATLSARSLFALFAQRRASTIAAVVFATSYVHAWPVGWVSNRNALIALTLGALALGAYVRARRRGRIPWLGASWFLGSLLAAEAGIAALGYIIAYEMTDGRALRERRLAGAALVVAVVVGWRLAYSHLEFGALGSGTYIDPLHAPAAFMSLAPERLGALVRFLSNPAQSLTNVEGSLQIVVEVALLALAIPVVRFGLEASRRLWLIGAALCLIPVLTSIAQPRLLGFSVLGIAPLIAGAMVELWSRERVWSRLLAAALAALHLVLSPLQAGSTVKQASLGEGPQLGEPGVELGNLKGKNLVILNAPTLVIAQQVTVARAQASLDAPAFLWILSVGEVELEREGCCTVIATDPAGLFRERWSATYRGRHVSFSPGDRVKTLAFEAEILEASQDGLATSVAFRFDGPLRSKQYVLAQWNGEDFEVVLPNGIPRAKRAVSHR